MHGLSRIIFSTGKPLVPYVGVELTCCSSLGRYDGKVFEDTFNRAHRLNPLNKITYNPDYKSEEIVMGSGDGGRQILSKL
jgi:hypothetical protein